MRAYCCGGCSQSVVKARGFASLVAANQPHCIIESVAGLPSSTARYGSAVTAAEDRPLHTAVHRRRWANLCASKDGAASGQKSYSVDCRHHSAATVNDRYHSTAQHRDAAAAAAAAVHYSHRRTLHWLALEIVPQSELAHNRWKHE